MRMDIFRSALSFPLVSAGVCAEDVALGGMVNPVARSINALHFVAIRR